MDHVRETSLKYWLPLCVFLFGQEKTNFQEPRGCILKILFLLNYLFLASHFFAFVGSHRTYFGEFFLIQSTKNADLKIAAVRRSSYGG